MCQAGADNNLILLGIWRCENPLALSWGQALTHRAEVATALCRGRELHLTTIPGPSPGRALDRQNMPPSTGRAGQIGPAGNQLCRRHSRAGEEPPGLQLTLAVATQPAQAHRFTRRHPFEDLRPLLSRRTSPNVPSDNSIVAPVGRLPQGSELYSRRVAQAKNSGKFRIRHYMCACPSAKAGTQARNWVPASALGDSHISLQSHFELPAEMDRMETLPTAPEDDRPRRLVYSAHARIRKSLGEMTRKLSDTASQ